MSVEPKTNVILTRDKVNVNDRWKVETFMRMINFGNQILIKLMPFS